MRRYVVFSDHCEGEGMIVTMRAIDVWGQIPTGLMAEAPWLSSLARWTGKTAADFRPSVEDTLRAMDGADVEIMLLSAWYGPHGPLVTNEDVARYVASAPDRFRGVASADIGRPAEAVREIRRWVDGEAFVAVRVVPWLWNMAPNDRRYYPVYVACVELGVPFCTQIGHTGPLLPSDVGRPIPYLEDVLLDFPELTVVGGHLGFPWLSELTSLILKFPNFFVDTSAYVAHRFPREFVEFMKTVGSDRVMFGSNWPMLSPEQCVARLDDLELSAEQAAMFLSDNARKVFKLGES